MIVFRYGFRSRPNLSFRVYPKVGEKQLNITQISDWIEQKLLTLLEVNPFFKRVKNAYINFKWFRKTWFCRIWTILFCLLWLTVVSCLRLMRKPVLLFILMQTKLFTFAKLFRNRAIIVYVV